MNCFVLFVVCVMVLSSWNRSALLAFVSYVGLSVVASVVVCVVVSVCSA